MKYTREAIVERLQQGVARVEYKKLDGEARSMDCTLDPVLTPETRSHKAKRPDDLVTAYDVGRGVWRSFYVGNVTNVV